MGALHPLPTLGTTVPPLAFLLSLLFDVRLLVKMPGSSLWLIPPATHPLHAILTTLITDTLPSLLLPPPSPSSSSSSLLPTFSPHLTLTSSIPPATYSPDPQAWLDSIPFPSSADVRVSLESVRTEDVFLRRCYLRAEFAGVRDIAAAARAAGVESEGAVGAERTAAWLEKWRTGFGPHVSLA